MDAAEVGSGARGVLYRRFDLPFSSSGVVSKVEVVVVRCIRFESELVLMISLMCQV